MKLVEMEGDKMVVNDGVCCVAANARCLAALLSC